MRQEKKSGRGHRKIGFLDLFFLGLLFLSVFGIVFRQYTIDRKQDADNRIGYRFYAMADAVERQVCESLKVGDRLYTASGEVFGEIAAVEYRQATHTVLSGGVYYQTEWENDALSDLRMELAVLAIPTERGVLVDGYRAAVGRPLPILYSDKAVLNLVVYKLNSPEP